MIYEKIALAVGVCALVSNIMGDFHAGWNTEVKENFSHTFSNDQTLDVDNVNGSIRVTGDNGGSIRMEGEKVIRALNQQEADRARREVTLDLTDKEGVARVFVKGPFRNHDFHGDRHVDYEVAYNFVIHVPRQTALQIRSVNGAATAEQTRGNFDLHTVNGRIRMTGIAGSGNVKTVNGPLSVSFAENPRAASTFETVNGRIEASFQPNLSADLRLKTVNGQAYTDFETAAAGSPPDPGERKSGRFVYRSHRVTSLRIGAGGPELSFQTVNGEIDIRKGAGQ